MTPLDKEVAEFMKSNGFEPYRWENSNGLVLLWFHKGEALYIPIKEATFFYTATKQRELSLLRQIAQSTTIENRAEYIADMIVELEAQLNNSNKEDE